MVSGLIGIGGGILLSPLLLLLKWADAKRVSATAAAFIVVNSIAGLTGQFVHQQLQFGASLHFIFPALLGGMLGAYLGANRFSRPVLCRVLAVVLLLAASKMLL